MDEQTNNPGGNAPTPSEPTMPSVEPTPTPAEPAMPVVEPTAPAEPATPVIPEPATPAAPAAQPQTEEKCVTCGGPASGGTCIACGQGEITCTCQPASPSQGGPAAPLV